MNLKKLAVLPALAIALILGLMVFTSNQVSASAPLTVGNATSPGSCIHALTTIQDAVNAANPGDTIMVCAGTYSELVTVNKSLTIKGAQAGVDGRSGSRTGLPATESVVNGTSGSTSFYLTANNVTLDGFTVEGETSANVFGFGILLGAGTSGAHVVNNIVQNNVIGLGLANSPSGNQAVIQFNLFLTNNQTGPASGAGIYTDEFVGGGLTKNVLIDNNRFVGNDDAGIDFSGGAPGTETGITISNNEFDSNSRAVFLLDMTSSTISGNNIHNSTSGLTADIRIFGGVSGVTISCNNLANGAGRAIRINDGNGCSPACDPNSSIAINKNNISGYPVAGLEVDSSGYTGGPGSLDATSNWWANSTGPTIASNPGGTGELIIDPDGVVNYTPFLTTFSTCAPLPKIGPPTNKDQCKNGGWMNFTVPERFKNQGDCIQYVNTGK